MIEAKDISIIGKFQRTHALKGELNAILDVEPEYISEGNALVVEMDGIFVPFYSSSIRPKAQTSYLIKLDGINSEEEAQKFVNKPIYALKSELAPFLDLEEEDILEEGDLNGFTIIDSASQHPIGIIKRIDTSTQNLLFIVESPEGRTIFIPLVEEFIETIDEKNHQIRMNLPDGLIDLN